LEFKWPDFFGASSLERLYRLALRVENLQAPMHTRHLEAEPNRARQCAYLQATARVGQTAVVCENDAAAGLVNIFHQAEIN
jgi:hypothetical protein